MDFVLDTLDPLFLDDLYSKYFPAGFENRDFWVRQYITIFWTWWIGGYLAYLSFAAASWYFIFDKNLRKHPLFLKNQERQEITVALYSIPIMAIPSTFIFLGELRGYSMLYDEFNYTPAEIGYVALSVVLYLLFTDALIYWIHRILHWPIFYAPIHKLHHRWVISTPFASHAFHPLDGFSQSAPYHIFAYIFPLHKMVYLGLFIFVNAWTISIHDNNSQVSGTWLLGAGHHTVHHRKFNYNYGQYFVLWDKLMGTCKEEGTEPVVKAPLSPNPTTEKPKAA